MAKEDISLEPLFNQSSTGIGTNKKIAVSLVNNVGAASNRTVGLSATRKEITIGTGKVSIEIFNPSGGETIYYGGSGVTTGTGIPLFQNQTKIFANVKDTFSIYFITASGSVTARIVEYA